MRFTLPAEGRGPCVEVAVDLYQVQLPDTHAAEPRAQRNRVRRLLRPVAAVTAAIICWAKRAAAGVSHGAETGRAVRDQHAHVSAQLAFHADAVGRRVRLALIEEGADYLDELALVDRASLQLEIHFDVRRNRCGGAERADVFGRGVNNIDKLAHVAEVPQRLNAASRGAGADGHQVFRRAADLLNAFGVLRSRDRAFDQ